MLYNTVLLVYFWSKIAQIDAEIEVSLTSLKYIISFNISCIVFKPIPLVLCYIINAHIKCLHFKGGIYGDDEIFEIPTFMCQGITSPKNPGDGDQQF